MPQQTAVLVLSALALGATLLVYAALRQWTRRKATQARVLHDPANKSGVHLPWVAISLRALMAPVTLLIWIQGAYVSLRLLLPQFSAGDVSGLWASSLRWGYSATIVLALCWLLSRAGGLIERFLVWQSSRTKTTWDDVMLPLAGRTARRTLPLLAIILGAPALGASPALQKIVSDATSLIIIGIIAFVLFQTVEAATALVLRQYRLDSKDNLHARAVHTQVTVLKKVASTAIIIFTLASMLMVFDSVRQFGASILASAGIAGIIVGLAAQKSIATLLAGFQIALTQPIRVDDVVVVENEWGRVEDITLTYVVVRIWDLRRLVLPISYFIEHPFQNWTRTSAEVLAAVTIHVDYEAPIEALRQELTRILGASAFSDGKVNVLQVTEAREHTIEVRALASAADASLAWDLRCEIREKLVAFLQQRHHSALPRLRMELERHASDARPSSSAPFETTEPRSVGAGGRSFNTRA
ncbi:MAG: mechanosensitive ion channel domain-containing protein [Acidobacteriota bacterium]